MGVLPGIPGLPKGDWYGLAERAVTAFETYVNGDEELDLHKIELELIQFIHEEYADRLDTVLDFDNQMKKMKALRSMAEEARKRSGQAKDRLESEYGQTG